ncbi:SprT-like family-domain-containing protein [Camillea tinctor]|nr:SprT-like family-domain-containing protein [Camillea tinctor]
MMAHSSASEVEFPGNRSGGSGSKESVSVTECSTKTARNSRMRHQAELDLSSTAAVKATPIRRRKLGKVQTMDGSLFKPWTELDGDGESRNRVVKSKTSRRVRSREESADFKLDSVGALWDPLPSKAQGVKSTTPSSSEEQSDSPGRLKRSRRLVSRGALKLKSRGSAEVEKSGATPSESESEPEEPDEDDFEDSDDGLSDFIVSSDSETEDEASNSDSDIFVTPPTRRSKSPTDNQKKPLRLLPSSKEQIKGSVKNKRQETKPDRSKTKDPVKRSTKQSAEDKTEFKTVKENPKKTLEDDFKKLQIFNEESDSDDTKVKGSKTRILEPSTPTKTKLPPSKCPGIPESPWKPENLEFWDPEVNFAWIDKHSPPKRNNPDGKKKLDLTGGKMDNNTKVEIKRRYGNSPEKRDAKKAFEAIKESLARDFLQELDERITNGRLAQMTEATGGLRIVWSNTLLTTAGRAHWKCKTVTTTTSSRNKGALGTDGVPTATNASTTTATATTTTTTTQHQHQAFIELASKVLANRADLLNTVAHEFCHLAVFMLDGGKPKSAHGPEFKAWGRRCGAAFADRGIEVTTKHSYEIEYKYIWRCDGCTGEVKRHSKSVDTVRQRCGVCRGVLVQVKPVPRGGGGGGDGDKNGKAGAKGEGGQKKKPSAWQEFMAKEMKVLTQTNKGMPLKERMAIVSARWQEQQKKGVKSLAGAVEVLEIRDDDDDGDDDAGDGAKGKGKETSKGTAEAYDLFA